MARACSGIVDLGREGAVEVERNEQPSGAREFPQRTDEGLRKPGGLGWGVDIDHGDSDRSVATGATLRQYSEKIV